MWYTFIFILISLFFNIILNILSSWPFFISFFHVSYGKGRWGWFIVGVIGRISSFFSLCHELLDHPETDFALMFIFDTIFGVLIVIFFFRLIKRELQKRDRIE